MLPIDTIIPTADGPKPAGDIQPGDELFAPDGTLTTATAVTCSPGRVRTVFISNKNSIELSDAAVLEVVKGHDRTWASGNVRQNALDKFNDQKDRAGNIAGLPVHHPAAPAADTLVNSAGSPLEFHGRENYPGQRFSPHPLFASLVSAYGHVNRKGEREAYLNVRDDIEDEFLAIVETIGVPVRKVANGSAGRSRRYAIRGWYADRVQGVVADRDKVLHIVHHLGAISAKRSAEYGIEGTPDGTWIILEKEELQVTPTDDSGARDFLYGYMNATGTEKAGSGRIWSSAGFFSSLADRLASYGIETTVLAEEGSNSFKFNTHLPESFGTCSEFLNSHELRDAVVVRDGFLAGCVNVRTMTGTMTYAPDVEFATNVLGGDFEIDDTSGWRVYLDVAPEATCVDAPYTHSIPMFLNGREVTTEKRAIERLQEHGVHQSNYTGLGTSITSAKVLAVHKRPGSVMIQPSRQIDFVEVQATNEAVAEKVVSRVGTEAPSTEIPTSFMNASEILHEIRKGLSKPSFYTSSPVEYPGEKQELPIDPYVLGCWLGDGVFRTGYICGEDVAMFRLFEERGYDLQEIKGSKPTTSGFGDGILYVMKLTHRESGKTLNRQLVAAGYKFGPTSKDGGKRIPEEYLRASFEDRMELLRGLMDTDGCHTGEFVSSYDALAGDVVRLTRELGMRVNHTPLRKTSYSHKGVKHHTTTHRIMIYTTESMFSLDRKQDRHVSPGERRYTTDRHITSIGRDRRNCEMVTIVTDRPFLAGDCYVPIMYKVG